MNGRIVLLSLLLAADSGAQTIMLTPADALADAPTRIEVEGLAANQPVVLRAHADDASGVAWQSWAGFESDGGGRVDLAVAAPKHGTYDGPDSMGLFWSMDVAGEGQGRRRFDTHGLDAVVVRIDLETGGKRIATALARRRFVGLSVSRAEVRTEAVVGTMFTPSSRPRAAVLVIGGSEGGPGDVDTAALLASHGYAAFAIAYFGSESLPKSLAEVPLETFHAAIEYLKRQLLAEGATVSLLGTSKGAEAALLVAAERGDIRAVVAFAPSSVVWSCLCDDPKSSWTRRGRPLPFVAPGRDPTSSPPPGFPTEPGAHYEYRLRHAPADAFIEVEKVSAPVMLVAGSDDRLWPSALMARQIIRRRESTSLRMRDRLLVLDGAGHLIGKAFLPAGSTRIGNGRIETGGSTAANARAQATAWPAVLEFLSR